MATYSRRLRGQPRIVSCSSIGTSGGIEWRFRVKDVSYLPVEVSSRILDDGRWQGVVRDVSERKRLENEQTFLVQVGRVFATSLDDEETLSRVGELAVRSLSDLCIIDLVDDEGRVRRLRVARADSSQPEISDVLERAPADRHPSGLVRSVLESRQPFLIQHVSSSDLEALAQVDDHLDALRAIELQSVIAVPLLSQDRLLGAISLLSSTRDRVYDEQDLRVAGELAQRTAFAVDNARLYRAAQRAIQVRDEVLGIVAHDLRNPLSTIMVEAQILRRHGPVAGEVSDAIARAATGMNRLIHDLLDVSRMEAGRLTVEPSRISAERIASVAVDASQFLPLLAPMRVRTSVCTRGFRAVGSPKKIAGWHRCCPEV